MRASVISVVFASFCISITGCAVESDAEPPLGQATAASTTGNFIYVGTSYGYAGATFDFASASRVDNIDLVVSDWGCDATPVYAYFLWYNGSRWDSTPTHRFDYSGCDTGDNTVYNNLSWSVSGDYIDYMAVVVCRDAFNGPCTASFVSDRNPYAPF